MRFFVVLIPVLLLHSLTTHASPKDIIFTRAFADDAYGYYHAQILQRCLELTPELGEANAVAHPQPMPQARQIIKLKAGEGHVMWSATSDEREKELLPVRFPLLQGLAGYRVLVIGKFKQGNYPHDISREKLQGYLGVQGADWPDLAVLRHNGFRVEGAPWSLWFNSMFVSVEKGLVDYFPRNVIEVTNDLDRHKDKRIQLEQNLILRYPNYEYFFVSPQYPDLVSRIETGLLRMLQNGELIEYFNKHNNHRLALALAADPNRVIVELENPGLSKNFKEPLWGRDPQPMIDYLQNTLQSAKH